MLPKSNQRANSNNNIKNSKNKFQIEQDLAGVYSSLPCTVEEESRKKAALSNLNSQIVCIEVGTLLNKYQQRF